MHNLSKVTKRLRLKVDGTNYTGSAGTSDLTSEKIDMLGYESVLIRIGFGTITAGAVTSIKCQQSSDDAAADTYDDLAGTAQTVADTDDNKVFEIEIHKPAKRYLKHFLDRGTQNAVVDFLEAFLYNPVKAPPTQDSTVGGTETFVTPAEGTA